VDGKSYIRSHDRRIASSESSRRKAGAGVAPYLLIGDRPERWPLPDSSRDGARIAESGAALAAEWGLHATPLWREVDVPPAQALAALADEYDVDLIVVGRRT